MDKQQIEAVIDDRRASHGKEGFDYRAQAEEAARHFLDQYAGSMNSDQAMQLGALFNKDFNKGREYNSRFAPAFQGATMQLLTEDLQRFNEVTRRIWRAEADEGALETVGGVIEDKTVLPGAGRSYPTMLMYLRNPEKWPIWIHATDAGLRAATDFAGPGRSGGAAGYITFAEAAKSFAEEYGLRPQEMDTVLTQLGRIAKQAKASKGAGQGEGRPSLPVDAFTFLTELRDNNTHAWMEENKDRFRRSVKRPFRQIMHAVAQKYIQPLDPEIDTEVKFGHVMGSIHRRFPDEEGDYWPFYWGSFSRARKQDDVQLYVSVRPDFLEFGFGMESAQPNHFENLRTASVSSPDLLWAAVEGARDRLTFEQGDKRPLRIEEPADLSEWALGESPHLLRRIRPEDPLATSPELVDEIGHVLRTVHPFARAAWGDSLDEELLLGERDEEEVEGEEYPFDLLQADTLLPADILEEWIALLQGEKRQAIFYGPPGTGKTWVAQRLARYLAGPSGTVKTVQFHPSFSYEDFLEGLRPESSDGTITYSYRPGVFTSFCDEARGKETEHVLVIDEINRAELGSVLGELMLLLEYREEAKVPLPYSRRQFSVPRNVTVLATMNTADRSLALVDYALRRRFHAIEMLPDPAVLARYLEDLDEPTDGVAMRFFHLIQEQVSDASYSPGHSYWMQDDVSPAGLELIWKYELRPYLAEYWFEDQKRLRHLDEEVTTLLGEES